MLNFSPSWCGNKERNDWKPALIDCIRRLSFELAISRRILFSSTGGAILPAADETDAGTVATAAADVLRDMFGVTGDSAFSLLNLKNNNNKNN